MGIDFERETQNATFYSPLEDFEETSIEVEVRVDPLTGRQTRIVPDSFVIPDTEPDIDEVVADDEGCFFCPDTVESATPTYPDFVGMERGTRGEATSFPNLNPYGSHSNVVVLTRDHYVPIGEFTTDIFADGLNAAFEYISRVFEADDEAAIVSINMNYLRPAGSSIVHPHVQTVVDDRGTNGQQERLDGAREYYAAEGRDYWADLLAAERDSPRAIGRTESVQWLAPFAPRHHRHVLGVLETTAAPAVDAPVVEGLATGIVNVLSYFADLGLNSFNFGIHLVPGETAVRPVIDVVARSVFDQYYWSDATFFETIHREAVIDVAPETYAAEAAEFF